MENNETKFKNNDLTEGRTKICANFQNRNKIIFKLKFIEESHLFDVLRKRF